MSDFKTTVKEKYTPSEILMNSLVEVEKATGVIIILDYGNAGTYTLRSNLTVSEICGLFELTKHHVIQNKCCKNNIEEEDE